MGGGGVGALGDAGFPHLIRTFLKKGDGVFSPGSGEDHQSCGVQWSE